VNAPLPLQAASQVALHDLLLGFLAPHASPGAEAGSAEADWLHQRRPGTDPVAALSDWLKQPPASALPLLGLVAHLQLGLAELVALALASAVETDAMTSRVVAWLQAPLPGSRPTVGLVTRIAQHLHIDHAAAQLAQGAAARSRVLQWVGTGRPFTETALQVPLPIVLALQGQGRHWPGLSTAEPDLALLTPASLHAAGQHAKALASEADTGTLIVRAAHPVEARAACAAVARALGRWPVFVEGPVPDGLGPWAWMVQALPVIVVETAPGEHTVLPELDGYGGPVLVATGFDGSFARHGSTPSPWTLPMPAPVERGRLWQRHLDDAALAGRMGHSQRCGAFHIGQIARAAAHQARLEGANEVAEVHLVGAIRDGAAPALGTLAERVPETIDDAALVVPAALGAELEALRQRCCLRETLTDALGPAARTRYRPGVRALLVGPSGTGKTLAAGWLASRLGLPLYRIDAAAVSSKYIGETEKNLSQLFARAEHSDVVLLFDEADSLFGKRTEVKESNDRFANAQTNYLLQRMESFEGIAILTSNSRARFDAAFTRRLDAILEFPAPGPEERRRLWLGHLGAGHALTTAQINQLAAVCDLAGGHVRNATLMASVSALQGGRAIGFADVLLGVAAEYRKLGRQLPSGLQLAGGAVP
jgi:hypothetical protein